MKTNNTNLKFVDYSSFEELSENQEILKNLINGYRNIFSEPDVWNEQYSAKEIHEKLIHDLDGQAALRLCIDNHCVVGFCWAQFLKANDITAAMQSVHYYKAYDSLETEQSLDNIIGKDSVIYVHDLGVNKSYRGTVPLEHLICPVIENISQRSGTRSILFWSVEETSVAWLAQKIGVTVALQVGKMQVYNGQYPVMSIATQ